MSGRRYAIVYFSIVPWDFIHQRMHALCAEFAARGHEVFFIEPPHLKKGYQASFNHSKLGFSFPDAVFADDPAPRVHDITVPRRFSFGRFKFDLHFLEFFGTRWLVKLVAEVRRRTALEVILIFSSPIYYEVATRANFDFSIFDLIDDPALLSVDTEPATYRRKEKALVEASDCVFVTADVLAEYVRERYPGKRIEFMPNGVDFDWFTKKASASAAPDLLRDVPRPIAGFTGALYDWIDVPLLIRAARARPKISFVFVGYRTKGGIYDELINLPNVHYFEERPYEEIPAWVNSFDVCLVPFASGTIAKFTNPKKLYEYLALGKPTIVSAHLSELAKLGDIIHITKNEDDFLETLDKAVKGSDVGMKEKAISFARANSWSARVEKMEAIIGQSLDKRAKGS